MPRNDQLVRQWKLLRYLGNGYFPLEDINMNDLGEILERTHKTIRRDLEALLEAGFFTAYGVKDGYNKIVRAQRVHKLERIPRIREEIRGIEKLSSSEAMLDMDLFKCNHCTYRFRKLDNGKIDMLDFRTHKATHHNVKTYNKYRERVGTQR